MLVKLYWMIWGVFGLAVLAFYAAGSLTMLTGSLFGFVAFGLVFMGMIGVLPFMVSHPASPAPEKTPAPKLAQNRETPAKAFGIWKSA
jgi:hypothetical protein